jgi:type II secretory pathway component GspD/PulD (secretin)
MASAESLKCDSLRSCIQEYGDVTQEDYITQEKLERPDFQKVQLNGTPDELDQAFSFVLHQNGLTRIKGKENQTYIVPTRDVRYMPTNLVKPENAGTIPSTYDYFMVEYKMRNQFLGEYTVRALRPFMSRYGRIIHNKVAGHIVLQDTGVNIHRLLTLIKEFDVELSKEELKEVKRTQKHARKLQLLRAKKGGH